MNPKIPARARSWSRREALRLLGLSGLALVAGPAWPRALLGYDSEWMATETGNSGSVIHVRRDDMLNELEEDRYFVVLMAYDFQAMSRQKKSRLLRETHISIREHANAFDQRLAGMLGKAAAYFGTDSHGLRREELPGGKVEMGAIKSLGVVEAK